MAKTVDLRTYILLEKAFVRRLQRTWRIQSAPIYSKITQACLDHRWDEARRLVPDLDMAEVGTQNREWIQYMLLSCAVFGANTIAKGKPSFVGVGTFDTFLKQTTNNILQYLEYSATAQVQKEALQSIAEDEAQTKVLKWDEAKHPRDAEGQFTGKGIISSSYDGYQHTLTMTLDGEEVGAAKLRYDGRNHLADFDILYITPDARGHGFGEYLYRAVADKAKALGATRILGDVTSAGILKMGVKVLGKPEYIADNINEFTLDEAMKKLEPLAPENAEGVIDTANYLGVRWPLKKKTYRKAGAVFKWDEAKHPRDKEGQFAAAGALVDREGFTGMEGGGPERDKWEILNDAVMDAQEAYIDAKRAHQELIKTLNDKHGGTPLDYTPDEWTEYKKSQGIQEDLGYAQLQAETALAKQYPVMRREVVMNLATGVAKQLGVDPSIIEVVDEEARAFDVGNKHFTEAGHYDPDDKIIELNSRNINYGNAQAVKGVVAHEISHAIYHAIKDAADAEFRRYLKKAVSPSDQHTEWYRERFAVVGDVKRELKLKPEYRAEFERDYPASMAMAILGGGEPFTGISKQMVQENGHTQYSKSYWAKEAIAAKGSMESAINETIAEITRYLSYPSSYHSPDVPPHAMSPWVKLTANMLKWHKANS